MFFLNVLGKILNDDTALKEYKIDEKNFVSSYGDKSKFQPLVYIFIHGNLKKDPKSVFT